MNDITKKYRIPDKDTEQAMSETSQELSKLAGKGFEILEKETKKSDAGKLTEGKRYIDTTADGTVRLVIKHGNDIYIQPLTKLS